MNITVSEQKQGSGTVNNSIGYWKGPLVAVNPTKEKLKELYNSEGDVEEPKYQGTDKSEKDWAKVRFLFQDEMTKKIVKYDIFMSKDIAEFEVSQGDGKVTKTWWVNQWGQSQCVTDKKDLWRSFTHLQKQNEEKKWVDVLDGDTPIELKHRKAYKGETALYALLRKMVTQNWYDATNGTDIFINIDKLMRGNVSEIADWIGTENYQSVVGMIEIKPEDGENGIIYYQNCVDGAWLPGWKYAEVNLTTQNKGWDKYEDKANGKGKARDIYEFYQAVKRNRFITEYAPIHPFDPNVHQAAGTDAIRHSDTVTDIDYDI